MAGMGKYALRNSSVEVPSHGDVTARKHEAFPARDPSGLKVQVAKTTLPHQSGHRVPSLVGNEARVPDAEYNQAQSQVERNVLDDTDIGSVDDTTTSFGEHQGSRIPYDQESQKSFGSEESGDDENDQDESMIRDPYDIDPREDDRDVPAERRDTYYRLKKKFQGKGNHQHESMLVNEAGSYPPTSSGQPESSETQQQYQEEPRPGSTRGGAYGANASQPREVRLADRGATSLMGPPSSKLQARPEHLQSSKNRQQNANSHAPHKQGSIAPSAQVQLRPVDEGAFDARKQVLETDEDNPHQPVAHLAHIQQATHHPSERTYASRTKVHSIMASDAAPPLTFFEKNTRSIGGGQRQTAKANASPSSSAEDLLMETIPTQQRYSKSLTAAKHADIDRPRNNARAEIARGLPEEEGHPQLVELDYDPEVLHKKDLVTLRDEPFDVDPRKQSDRDILAADLSLEEQVSATFKLPPEKQQDYFASLTIDQWEDAGDWFRDEFIKMLDRMKKARREKRDLVHKFEDEIERRHEAVVSKREETEEALAGMKNSGMRVLQVTPKKRQKHQKR